MEGYGEGKKRRARRKRGAKRIMQWSNRAGWLLPLIYMMDKAYNSSY